MSTQSRSVPSLLPCPMCGQEAEMGTNVVNRQVDDKGTYKSMTGYSVNCIWCEVNNRSMAEGYATPELAAERWNRRAARSETEQGIHEGRGSPPAGAPGSGSPYAVARELAALSSARSSTQRIEDDPVATILPSDPYDEREGVWFSQKDLRALKKLPAGTKLYTSLPRTSSTGNDRG